MNNGEMNGPENQVRSGRIINRRLPDMGPGRTEAASKYIAGGITGIFGFAAVSFTAGKFTAGNFTAVGKTTDSHAACS